MSDSGAWTCGGGAERPEGQDDPLAGQLAEPGARRGPGRGNLLYSEMSPLVIRN